MTNENTVSRRILIVDDNRDGATALARLVELTGGTTRTAFDGAAALIEAESFLPEMILLDVNMPVMNGYEACRQIRGKSWGKNILIVGITGLGRDENRAESIEAGFDCYFVKPLSRETLQKLLAQCAPRDS